MTQAAQDEQHTTDSADDAAVTEDGKTVADLWSEFDAAEGSAPAEASADDTGGANDDPPPDDAGDNAAPAEKADPGERRAALAAAADTTDDFDRLLSAATPELKAAFEKLQQSERSNRGRISAFQRQIDELNAKLERQAAPPAQGEAAGTSGADGAAEGFLASDEWKTFAEDYQDIAGPLGKVVAGLQAELRETKKRLDAHDDVRQQSALEEQADLLAEQHPDWQVVTAAEDFAPWLEKQPRYIREAVQRNAKAIVDAEEAADILSRFKADRSGQSHAHQENRSGQQGRSGTTGSLSGKRQRQLESSTAARSRGPGAVNGIPEDADPEDLWRFFDEQERRTAAQA